MHVLSTVPIEFLAPIFVHPPISRDFDSEDYNPFHDMTLQPVACHCGGIYARAGAYLNCSRDPEHWRFFDCVGRTNHPRNPEWEHYLDTNGRDAFTRAIQRNRTRI
jgi:hypothetical protein